MITIKQECECCGHVTVAVYEVKQAGSARFEKPTFDEMQLQAQKIGLPQTEIDKFWAYYESNGWKVGRNQRLTHPRPPDF